jgi:hypothetical protein
MFRRITNGETTIEDAYRVLFAILAAFVTGIAVGAIFF